MFKICGCMVNNAEFGTTIFPCDEHKQKMLDVLKDVEEEGKEDASKV